MLSAAAIAELEAPLGTEARPTWRGRLHQLGLVALVPAFLALVLVSRGTRARVGAVVYAVGFCSMLLVSTIYHRFVHTRRARAWWQRADHATIFAAIAGSFTPVCLLAVPDRWGLPLLALMWSGAVFGAAMKFTHWRHRRLAGGILYGVLSGLGVVVMPSLGRVAGPWPVVLMLVGGIFYTSGAVVLNLRRPRLRPAVFSYHEVWHACTVIAGVAHFGAVWWLTITVSMSPMPMLPT